MKHASLLSILVLLMAATLVLPARASDNAAGIKQKLSGIPTGDGGVGLDFWINEPGKREFKQGDKLVYHFSSRKDGYLTVVHVDSQGVVTVLFPNKNVKDNFLKAGNEVVFPDAGASFTLDVVPPTGEEFIKVILTTDKVDFHDVDFSRFQGMFFSFDGKEALDFADRLASNYRTRVALAGVPTGSVELTYWTGEKKGQAVEYTARGIVNHFTQPATRALTRPKMDFHIPFDFNSAMIKEDAKPQLNEIGKALKNDQLKGETFVLGGHTDDVGTETYNRDLSKQRAESVKRYLTDKFQVETTRLTTKAYGEDRPLVDGDSEKAREQNRRVELEMLR